MKEFLKSRKGKIIISVAIIVIIGLVTTGVCVYKYIQNIKMGTYRQLDEIALEDSGNYYLNLHDGSKIQLSDGKNIVPKTIVKDAEDKDAEQDFGTFYTDTLNYEIDICYNTKTDTLKYKILKEKENKETSYAESGQILSVFMTDNVLQFKVPNTKSKHKSLYLNLDSQTVSYDKEDKDNFIKLDLTPDEDGFVKCEIPNDKVDKVQTLYYDLYKKLKVDYNYYTLYELGQ